MHTQLVLFWPLKELLQSGRPKDPARDEFGTVGYSGRVSNLGPMFPCCQWLRKDKQNLNMTPCFCYRKLTFAWISLAHLVSCCFHALCCSGSCVISPAFPQIGPFFQCASLLYLPVLRRQADGPLSLLQVCQSHTLQDIHTASNLSAVKDNPTTAERL